jgi:hypothetical protein
VPYFPPDDTDRWACDYRTAVQMMAEGLGEDAKAGRFRSQDDAVAQLVACVAVSPWATDVDRCWLVLMVSPSTAAGPLDDTRFRKVGESCPVLRLARTVFLFDCHAAVKAEAWFTALPRGVRGD